MGLEEWLVHADAATSRSVLLIVGEAGTGKTHLVCDVAAKRVREGRPTVVLMGRRFLSYQDPWTQALEHLDLRDLAVDEFVGALEAAAQAAGCRALVMFDALNEGVGRAIWPSHLSAFLRSIEKSPWICVVLTLRSSYEHDLVPEDVKSTVTRVVHQGFAAKEYDAARSFFAYYGLELPSTPILMPEFRNPLFLKTLCQGLHSRGESRLTRGLHGITGIFDLYLDAINKQLAKELDFNPRTPLVRQALHSLAAELAQSGECWLAAEKAQELVNALLPGRDYSRSLYRGLIGEGAILEDTAGPRTTDFSAVVFIAYDLLADHLTAKAMLGRHLDTQAPASAFAEGGPLAAIFDEGQYLRPGLLEAMCVQCPELTGHELVHLAPKALEKWEIGDAFRRSVVWRDPNAISDRTREALRTLCRNEHDLHSTLDVVLTLAALPGHPLNAQFLDERLREDAMPQRDAWWSVYVHGAYGCQGALDRLVDWASSVQPDREVDDETVDLCAIALAWTLSTSNRFLRDSATKALVSLLTGRLLAAVRLVERFADVDDPYVTERVYAVAYGAAMRSDDPVGVGALATCVYTLVFANGCPPPHILLRDYARGIIERALHLGSAINVVTERIRPPYQSQWPTIPTEEDIKPLLPDWSACSYDRGDLEWARNRIGDSVMEDDFARYVIGTHSGLTNWMSLRLEEPSWEDTERREDPLALLVAAFTEEEKDAWKLFQEADRAYVAAEISSLIDRYRLREHAEPDGNPRGDSADHDGPSDVAALGNDRCEALARLNNLLGDSRSRQLHEILARQRERFRSSGPPRFDLCQVQRYVLWRVFDLGWTTERFGRFDRFTIGYHGREASKAERIGKKYQWIAYHEILALIADRFQYREEPTDHNGDQAYEGPWQEHLRDIDPSCTLRAAVGGTSWDGHFPSWWAPDTVEDWGRALDSEIWAGRTDEISRITGLLVVANGDGSEWLNVDGHFSWKQRPPLDREPYEVERKEIWYSCTGYLLRATDAPAFMTWAETVSFWGLWMPAPPDVRQMFLGEHVWSPASRSIQGNYHGDKGWVRPDKECPVDVRTVSVRYGRGTDGLDCSVDESFTLRLPDQELVTGLSMRWAGRAADYVDSDNRLVAFDPTAYLRGPSALLIRRDAVRRFLDEHSLTLCWTVLGEKRKFAVGLPPRVDDALQLSGAFVLRDEGIAGFVGSRSGLAPREDGDPDDGVGRPSSGSTRIFRTDS